MNRYARIASVLIIVSATCMSQTYRESLSRMHASVQALQSYQCMFVSFSRGPEKTDNVTFRYYYKQPGKVRMTAQTGKHEGTILLYTGSGDVRVKPGHGIFSWFSYSFNPSHRYVCDARGNGVHQSSWGYYIDEHIKMQSQTKSVLVGVEQIQGRKALKYDLTSFDPAQTRSIAHEELWIDAQLFLPIQYKQFDSTGTLIQSGLYLECVLGPDLNDTLFTEFSL